MQASGEVVSIGTFERWIGDILEVSDIPGALLTVEVDMSAMKALIAQAAEGGLRLTYTHVLVRATALALSRLPELNQVIYGNHRFQSPTVNIAVAVAGSTPLGLPLVIPDAGRQSLPELARNITQGAEDIRAKEADLIAAVERWGRLVPFGFLRRALLRKGRRDLKRQCQIAGSFQITSAPQADHASSLILNHGASLVAAGVKDRVVAREGIPVVRPILPLSLATNHRLFDGRRATRLLTEIRSVLEGDTLQRECFPDKAK